MHHILESKSFLSDFHPASTSPIPLSPPISMTRDPPAVKENVDSPSELEFAKEMRELRSGVVKTVPAIQKKEEEAREKLQRQKEREDVLAAGASGVASGAGAETAGGGGGGGGKRRKVEKKKISYAKYSHRQQVQGVTPGRLSLYRIFGETSD